MTPEDVDIIKSSFAKVFFDKDRVGQIFYRRLFEIAPDTRMLFKTDIETQSRKLMDTLAVAVSALRDAPALTVTLQDLGRRHAGYGAKPEHFGPVAEALLYALGKSLGPAFDAQTQAAWTSLYGAVANTMTAAMTPAADAA